MLMNVYMKTDTGKIRSSNQDAMFSMEPESGVLCAAVCDGMGGASGGNIASELCVQILQDQLQRAYRVGMNEKSIQMCIRDSPECGELQNAQCGSRFARRIALEFIMNMKGRICWRVHSVMKSIIWMVFCLWTI